MSSSNGFAAPLCATLVTLCGIRVPVAVAEPATSAYALVVGSNRGGSGQAPLQYAEGDARRVSDVLRELADYPAAQVRTLLAPRRAEVDKALDEIAARVAQHRARGESTQVFFYYS